MSEIPQELVASLTGPSAPLIAGHVTPDADCLTSMFALACGVRQATGREALCALPAGSVSSKLEFILELAQVALASSKQCREARLLAVCDTAKQRRTNLPEKLDDDSRRGRRIINIDHHASNTRFGDINYIDDHASSTAELIYRIFRHAGWELTPTVATLLFAGIHADTVGFSLPNATPQAFQAAADLVACGADVVSIGERLCRTQRRAEFELRRIIYDNTRLSDSGRIAYSSADHEEITRTGCSAVDIDDQVEIPRSLAGAWMAILFTEGHRGKVRINLRSKCDLSVLELARQIGGGGHRGAAGAVLEGSVPQAIDKVVPLAEEYLQRSAAES